MSNLKLLALLLVVGNLDCMQQKQPTGKDSSLAGAIAAVAVTGLLYYRQDCIKKKQLGSAGCGSSEDDNKCPDGHCEDVAPNCPRVFTGLKYLISSKPEWCSVKIKSKFTALGYQKSFDGSIIEKDKYCVVEDTYEYEDVKRNQIKMIRLNPIIELWAMGLAIESYTLTKEGPQESLLTLELINREQRDAIMRSNCNAVHPFIHSSDIDAERDAERAQQEEQQSRRSFMGVIRNAASYVASWFKRS